MSIENFNPQLHWNYFLAIESDIKTLSRWIELTENNYSTYSIEIARLLITTGSEIDVSAKLLAKLIDNNKNTDNLGLSGCGQIIRKYYTRFYQADVFLRKHELQFKPWLAWECSSKQSPNWWDAYNDIKHHRNTNFSNANLENLLNAMAALFQLEITIFLQLTVNEHKQRLLTNPNLKGWDLIPTSYDKYVTTHSDYFYLLTSCEPVNETVQSGLVRSFGISDDSLILEYE